MNNVTAVKNTRFSKKHYFKEIDRQEYHFLFKESPLEIIDAVSVYDIESFKYYLTLRFSRVTPLLIRSFSVRLFLYLDSPIPYKKLSYTYNVPKKKMRESIFGEGEYIPVPDTYYKRYEIFIDRVEFENSESVNLSLSSAVACESSCTKEQIASMDAEFTPSYKSENFPARVMPQFSQNAWICSCGQKNLDSDTECIRCSRLKERQKQMLEKSLVGSYSADAYSLFQRSRRADFNRAQRRETPDPAKEKQIENEIEKVERRERYKEKMKIQALPRFVLYFVLAYLVYLFIYWIGTLR